MSRMVAATMAAGYAGVDLDVRLIQYNILQASLDRRGLGYGPPVRRRATILDVDERYVRILFCGLLARVDARTHPLTILKLASAVSSALWTARPVWLCRGAVAPNTQDLPMVTS